MKADWIAVDLDGTLAEYHGWPADGSIGKPIPAMVDRVKAWLAEGKDVRIFTARVWPTEIDLPGTSTEQTERYASACEQRERIRQWCGEHLGKELRMTHVKDPFMIELWDDRAIQMIPNTGERAAP